MYALQSQILRGRKPKKIQKTDHLVPMAFGRIRTRHGKPAPKTIRVLFDSGGSGTVVSHEFTKNLRTNSEFPTVWRTAAGNFETKKKTKIQFTLPELHENKLIEWTAHVTERPMGYDLIIGRDLLSSLGIKIDFSKLLIEWDGNELPMKPIDGTIENSYHIQEATAAEESFERIKRILDAKYEPANLEKIAAESSHLNKEEQAKLLKLLQEYDTLFDGTLGHWQGEEYDIKLKPDATPYHSRSFPIPKVHERTLRLEVERLEEIGVLKKVNHSEWGAPTFIIPKKDGTVRFISDFRELNKRILRQPYPIPSIQDLLLKLEGFQYATSLDLNMGYYHIELTPNSKKLCTIVLPWGKYEYQRLPMGLCNSPDIFQEKMSNLMQGLESVRTYLDDVLNLTNGSFDDHLEKLAQVFARLKEAGLKVNANKSFFAKSELEYLGYWVTRNGIQPISKKVDAMLQIAPPKTKKELRRFIGMINYYRDMWIRRSEVLAPLTALTSSEATFKWTEVEQKAFETIKKIIGRETLLAYPNFNETFDIHTDASHLQLGAVISQQGRPIAFYSRKLQPAQTRYTTTERELLAIVETFKAFRNILLGQRIRVFTDHKNLTYKNFNTERVMRWRLILEEYGPEFSYVKGEHNVVADALSRLDLVVDANPPDHSLLFMAETFGLSNADLPSTLYPLRYSFLESEQQKDKDLMSKVRHNSTPLRLKAFRGGGKSYDLIVTNDDKIVIPKRLQKRVVTWYHETLCHPGETRTEQTIRLNFYWKSLRKDVEDICKKCHTCQVHKRKKKKYGHLPEKEAEAEPWERLCVDCIGPYTIKRKNKKSLTLWCVTMIDPATGWFEMRELPDKYASTLANIVEQTWLTRYPWPQIINYDRGTEFMAEFGEMVENDYGIKRKPITKRNPQANAIIERVHQTIANIIRVHELYEDDGLDEDDPFTGILTATMFAMRATYHTTMQATPTQLVFGRDHLLNTKFEADWAYIRDRKQRIIRQNNINENSKRIPHQYHVGDKVLLHLGDVKTKFDPQYDGPHEVVNVYDNGTIRIRNGAVLETVNIRIVHPYRE